MFLISCLSTAHLHMSILHYWNMLVSNTALDWKSEKKKLQKGIYLSVGFLVCHGIVVAAECKGITTHVPYIECTTGLASCGDMWLGDGNKAFFPIQGSVIRMLSLLLNNIGVKFPFKIFLSSVFQSTTCQRNLKCGFQLLFQHLLVDVKIMNSTVTLVAWY